MKVYLQFKFKTVRCCTAISASVCVDYRTHMSISVLGQGLRKATPLFPC